MDFNKIVNAGELLRVSSKAFEGIRSAEKFDFPQIRNYQLADYQYEILLKTIAEFESDLDDNHEVAAKLASFGQSVLISIESIGYSNPCLVHFYGTIENGSNVELIQHVSQINMLLIAVTKAEPDKPPRRIGYQLPAEDS